MNLKEGNLLAEALNQYSFQHPQVKMIRHNENQTYQVIDGQNQYLLRIHLPIDGFSLELFQSSYSKQEYVLGEMQLLENLNKTETCVVQNPFRNKNGNLVTLLQGGIPVTVLEWIAGDTVENLENTKDRLYRIGAAAAKLYQESQKMEKLIRYDYTESLQDKMRMCFKDALDKKQITIGQHKIFTDVLDSIRKREMELEQIGECKVLVHADLSPSNLIDTGKEIVLIDFSLSGYSFFYMDLGSLFGHFTKPEERNIILSAYTDVLGKQPERYFIEPYFCMQSLLYFACQHDKAAREGTLYNNVENLCDTEYLPFLKQEKIL